jgi:UDP-N-acetylglucosamine--N-acetylmuramyl-(pentapeptide) pyrophosphoryl-undecaprenol N-acetylglucosamine transferase
MDEKNYTFITCGTGGHVFPTLELVKEMVRQKYKVTLIIDKISGKKYKYITEDISKENLNIIYTTPFKKNIWIPFTFTKNIWEAYRAIKNSSIIIGFVAGIQFPILLLAVTLKKKIILHEQDSILNLTNKLFAKYTSKIFTSFRNVKNLNPKKQIWLGCPISKKFIDSSYNNPNHSKFITILGGSNGADFFDKVLVNKLINMKELRDYNIYHNCRSSNIDYVKDIYAKNGFKAVVSDFFFNYEELIIKSIFLITRGGASTISYLGLYDKNAIIIPWPNSAQNHQVNNGLILENTKASITIEEKNISQLEEAVRILIKNNFNYGSNIQKEFKCVKPDIYIKELLKYT